MLSNLSAIELGRLRLSVGYRTHKKGRPLSPVEVGLLLEKARVSGMSLQECATAIQLKGTGHIGRFLRILKLPTDIRHLIDWGSGKDFIGFSAAVEMAKLQSVDDQRVVAQAALSDKLNSKEISQVNQLRRRTHCSIEQCISETIKMRPTTERRYVFVGSVASPDIDRLEKLTQSQRDLILIDGIREIGILGASGRLGVKLFTLVGDDQFNLFIKSLKKESVEELLQHHISKAVSNV